MIGCDLYRRGGSTPGAKTFIGTKRRVRLYVWDIDACGDLPHSLHFSVSSLPLSAHKSTAFSSGAHHYYGESFAEALVEASRILQRQIFSEIPKAWGMYLTSHKGGEVQDSCGTVEGHGREAKARLGRGVGTQAPPAGIDLRTTPERAVDKVLAAHLLEIAKLQMAANGIADEEFSDVRPELEIYRDR